VEASARPRPPLGLEIERQRAEREPLARIQDRPSPAASEADSPALATPVARPVLLQSPRVLPPARIRLASGGTHATAYQRTQHVSSLLALRAAARRYSRQMQRDLEREAHLRGWERAA
jgi:hypothetical protein